MKSGILSVLLLWFAFVVSGCGNTPITSVVNASPEPLAVEDQDSLIAAMQAADATVEVGEPIKQDFFSPQGNIIKVNGADVQVFEYENVEAMKDEASHVAPDGGSIGTSMVTWMNPPHFYKAGRIMVLYVGSDQAILDVLEKVMGAQFAGQ
jgi:hypothetical protein